MTGQELFGALSRLTPEELSRDVLFQAPGWPVPLQVVACEPTTIDGRGLGKETTAKPCLLVRVRG